MPEAMNLRLTPVLPFCDARCSHCEPMGCSSISTVAPGELIELLDEAVERSARRRHFSAKLFALSARGIRRRSGAFAWPSRKDARVRAWPGVRPRRPHESVFFGMRNRTGDRTSARASHLDREACLSWLATAGEKLAVTVLLARPAADLDALASVPPELLLSCAFFARQTETAFATQAIAG